MATRTGDDMRTAQAVPLCRQAGEENPPFAVLGGDLAYANGRDVNKWHDWLDNWSKPTLGRNERSIPLIAGIGNHEINRWFGLGEAKAPFYFSPTPSNPGRQGAVRRPLKKRFHSNN